VVKKDRMRFARVRSPQDNQVGIFDLLIGARATACSENRRQTGDARSVSSTVTAVDVVAADNGACELLRQKVQLVGRFRAAKQAESIGSATLHSRSNTSCSPFESLGPRARSELVAVTDERLRQACKISYHVVDFGRLKNGPSYGKEGQ
jgi:hypothetical protein